MRKVAEKQNWLSLMLKIAVCIKSFHVVISFISCLYKIFYFVTFWLKIGNQFYLFIYFFFFSLWSKLNFNLDDTVKDGINRAIKRYTEQTSRLSMQALKYDKYGKNLLKKGGVSPDGVMQLSFQVNIKVLYHTITKCEHNSNICSLYRNNF